MHLHNSWCMAAGPAVSMLDSLEQPPSPPPQNWGGGMTFASHAQPCAYGYNSSSAVQNAPAPHPSTVGCS